MRRGSAAWATGGIDSLPLKALSSPTRPSSPARAPTRASRSSTPRTSPRAALGARALRHRRRSPSPGRAHSDEELQHRVEAFLERLRGHAAGGPYDAVMREVEKPLIAGALARANGVRVAAAAALGIDRGTLARRMRALGLDDT